MKVSKLLIIRISVISAIIVAIGVLWILKNSSTTAEDKTPVLADSTVSAPSDNAVLYGDLHITEAFDLAEFRAAGVPVLIDFGADDCIPCKTMAPILEALHQELQGRAIIRFVDVWKYRDLAAEYPLQVIPTQVFFDAKGQPWQPSKDMGLQFTQYATRDTGKLAFTTHSGGLNKEQLLAILEDMGMKR